MAAMSFSTCDRWQRGLRGWSEAGRGELCSEEETVIPQRRGSAWAVVLAKIAFEGQGGGGSFLAVTICCLWCFHLHALPTGSLVTGLEFEVFQSERGLWRRDAP